MTTNNIFQNTVCLSVGFHAPGAHRKGDINSVQTEADKQELSLSKRIFDSEYYQANRRVRAAAKAWLEKRSVPSPLRNGTYLIPAVLLDEVNAKLNEVIAEYNKTADDFAEEYPSLIEVWQEKLKDQFNAANYPSKQEIRRRFWVSKMVLDFAPSRPGEIDQSAEIEEAVLEIKYALRNGLLELVNRMTNMLGERKDGKKKAFRSETLEAFTEWMNLLPARLVVDDKDLMTIAGKAKKMLEGKSVDDLRDLEKVREQVRDGLEKTAAKLQGMLKDMPVRSFGFDD